MSSTHSLARFLKSHLRLVVISIALFSLLATATSVFFLHQRTGAHAAGTNCTLSSLYASICVDNLSNTAITVTLDNEAGIGSIQTGGSTVIGYVHRGTWHTVTIGAHLLGGIIVQSIIHFGVPLTTPICGVTYRQYDPIQRTGFSNGGLTVHCY